MYKILDKYKDTSDIRNMSLEELYKFAYELRKFLIYNVSKTGGHLASNLGVVELTISLYNVFDFNKDKLIWDVGHQAYVHKILTGRKDKFSTLKQFNGLSGFPCKAESTYDHFETGHSSTSISAALGMARARDINNEDHQVIAVIGDGALTGGMAIEALNDLAYSKSKMIIVLNDNQMSIGKNVGGLSTYLSRIRVEPGYNKLKKDIEAALKKIPNIGGGMARTIEKLKNGIKQIFVSGMVFENLGIKYLGPIDGHDIKELSKVMSKAKKIDGPVIIHIVTKKGKGYKFAEDNPDKFHGIGPFDYETGESLKSKGMTYSKAFGDSMIKFASKDKRIVAITAAMRDGTGLKEFASEFKDRFFDVAIAEQHAVTMAAGMATEGLKPVFAVYSTFLQRAYDQILHDVCIQKLPVIFAIDRAGIVGSDGKTHQGIFDLSYLSHMPNMTIMAPKCIGEVEYMLKWALKQNSPIAIRYPRGGDTDKIHMDSKTEFSKGKWETLDNNEANIVIIATGKMVTTALMAKQKLFKMGIEVSVINACFVKPVDLNMLKHLNEKKCNIITLEDNILHGGLGTLVLENLCEMNSKCRVKNLAFKDHFVPHGNVDILYKKYGLDVDGVVENVIKLM